MRSDCIVTIDTEEERTPYEIASTYGFTELCDDAWLMILDNQKEKLEHEKRHRF